MALSKVLGGVLSLAATAGIVLLAFGGACIVGCDSAGSSPGPETAATPAETAGETATRDVPEIPVGELSQDLLGKTVRVEGEVTKQCPASGCWFEVKDRTGEAFVDLNPSEIRLTEQRVGQRAQVTGKVIKYGGDLAIEAQDVEFETEQ